MIRLDLLKQAAEATGSSRNLEYGEPWNNLTATAALWQAYLEGKYGGKIVDPLQFTLSAEDVAWLNVLQKISRTFHGKTKLDTYIDAAAYSAIAGEVAQEDSYE